MRYHASDNPRLLHRSDRHDAAMSIFAGLALLDRREALRQPPAHRAPVGVAVGLVNEIVLAPLLLAGEVSGLGTSAAMPAFWQARIWSPSS